MKRLQISIEPELDEELDQLARRDGVSKAAVVRRLIRESARPDPQLNPGGPFAHMIGIGGEGGGTNDAEDHDAIIYSRDVIFGIHSEPDET